MLMCSIEKWDRHFVTLLNVVICVCSKNDINDGFVILLFKYFFLLLIRFHRCPVVCVLQARSWRWMEIDASQNGVSGFPDFVQTPMFAEGVRTGEPQGVLNKCYWVTLTLLLPNWTVGKWISCTNSSFYSSLLKGSKGRDWVTNNVIVVNWIQLHSQVCELISSTESQDSWKLSFELICEFIQVYLGFLPNCVFYFFLIWSSVFIFPFFFFYKIETRKGNSFLKVKKGCQIRVK